MTTHEESGHEESTQPQLSPNHDPQDRIKKGMENLSLEQSSRVDTDLLGKELEKLESDKSPSQEPAQVPQLDLPSKNESVKGPSQKPVQVPHLDLPSKSGSLTIPGTEEVIESEQVRIERLGRERPAKFKSLGAELAFCYSIIASQFMAVCINGFRCRGMLETNLLTQNRNTSYPVSMFSSQLL